MCSGASDIISVCRYKEPKVMECVADQKESVLRWRWVLCLHHKPVRSFFKEKDLKTKRIESL